MRVLITGGAGYIGSTVANACLDRGLTPVVLDDLSTGRAEFVQHVPCYLGDVADPGLLDRVVVEQGDIDVVVHCAAKIVVEESVRQPLDYFSTNVAKTIALLQNLRRHAISALLFSSSASVYAPADAGTVTESSPVAPLSPYAQSKCMTEQVLASSARATGMRVIALRYFNPVGADPLLRTGSQLTAPTHLMGRLLAALRTGAPITINGTDWPTRDGTPVRDFIHVWDLAQAHVHAIERLATGVSGPGFEPLNVGTGLGTTVAELVTAFSRIVGARLDVRRGPRRPGDTAGAVAATQRAAELLGWQASMQVEDFVRDSVRWLERRQAVLGY